MPQICLYLQLHQPYRLRDFSLLEIGHQAQYFSEDETQGNKAIFQKVSHKSYLPMLELLGELTRRHSGFKVALSCSGIFLEQALEYQPRVIRLLGQLAQSGQVEFLSETYFHSLASLYSPTEFHTQVILHTKLRTELFGVKPDIFRNTELIYSNQVAELVADCGFKGMLTEGVSRHLFQRPKTRVYQSYGQKSLPLLLKHAELSDDIAFRFSDRNWRWFPLTVERYLEWIHVYQEEEIINLFMDFETFGEHQWDSTGIFSFFATFVESFLHHSWNSFVTPSEVLESAFVGLKSQEEKGISEALYPVYDVPDPISWADVDRDLTAWTENAFQKDCLRIIYQLEKTVLETGDQSLITDRRKLQTSDHFYYMCTKWSADGDVHAYFSPYRSPYEAYRRYSIVLADLRDRVEVDLATMVRPV